MYIMAYHHWSKFLLVEFVPYVLLIVLNSLIWRRVRAMVKMREQCGFEGGEHARARYKENPISAFSQKESPGRSPAAIFVCTFRAHLSVGRRRRVSFCHRRSAF